MYSPRDSLRTRSFIRSPLAAKLGYVVRKGIKSDTNLFDSYLTQTASSCAELGFGHGFDDFVRDTSIEPMWCLLASFGVTFSAFCCTARSHIRQNMQGSA